MCNYLRGNLCQVITADVTQRASINLRFVGLTISGYAYIYLFLFHTGVINYQINFNRKPVVTKVC